MSIDADRIVAASLAFVFLLGCLVLVAVVPGIVGRWRAAIARAWPYTWPTARTPGPPPQKEDRS